jgi:adenylate cyclase class 2
VPASHQETEIKLPLRDAESGRALLARAGFHISRPRVFESNLVFDTAQGRLRAARCLLRLREAGGAAVLTYKGPSAASRHKVREEIEVSVSAPDGMRAILERLGYAPAWRYDKFRTEYARAGASGRAYLDETPIGVHLELEGPPEWIDDTARQLGFTEPDYILQSYWSLYTDRAKRDGVEPGDMVFPQEATSKSQPNPGLSDGRV